MMNYPNYGYNGYNTYNPYQQPQQTRFNPLKIYSVSNIMEANATPVDGLEPMFFYNKAENVVYKKQIDNTGAAPIQIYKLNLSVQTEQEQPQINYIESINNKIDTLQKSFDDYIRSKNEITQVEEDRKGKK